MQTRRPQFRLLSAAAIALCAAIVPLAAQNRATHHGSCLCGTIRYEIKGELGPIVLCHCAQCRKAQGSAFAANAIVQVRDFAIVAGQDSLAAYESSWNWKEGVDRNPQKEVQTSWQVSANSTRLAPSRHSDHRQTSKSQIYWACRPLIGR